MAKPLRGCESTIYGGSGTHNEGALRTIEVEKHGRDQSLSLTLAPLSTMIFELVEVIKTTKKSPKAMAEAAETPKIDTNSIKFSASEDVNLDFVRTA